jgi:hypothetical protein
VANTVLTGALGSVSEQMNDQLISKAVKFNFGSTSTKFECRTQHFEKVAQFVDSQVQLGHAREDAVDGANVEQLLKVSDDLGRQRLRMSLQNRRKKNKFRYPNG